MRRILPVVFFVSVTATAAAQAPPPGNAPPTKPPAEAPAAKTAPAADAPPVAPPGDAPATQAPPAPAPGPVTDDSAPPAAEPPAPPNTEPPAPPAAEPPRSVVMPPLPAPAWGFGAATTPQADTGAKPSGTGAGAPKKEEKLPFRLSALKWDHSATTETVGIGRDIQSRNPVYEMSFILEPRYYLWEADDPTQHISVRGRLDLIREFTNSDTTAERGQWTFSDLLLFPQYGVTAHKQGDFQTDLGIRLPTLSFPTSVVSANSGRVIQVGTMLLGSQKVPLLGSSERVLQAFALTLRGAYAHWFTEAKQPTHDGLARVRMGPDGRTYPGDQLGGAAFAEHNVTIDAIGVLDIHERVKLTTWFQWGLAWKYQLDREEPICNVATGCVTPRTVDNPTNYAVTTLFNPEIEIDVLREFELDLGYANLTAQIGPDGQRRNIFYSPDARVYTTFVAKLDELYLTASGTRQTAKAPAPRRVAKVRARGR